MKKYMHKYVHKYTHLPDCVISSFTFFEDIYDDQDHAHRVLKVIVLFVLNFKVGMGNISLSLFILWRPNPRNALFIRPSVYYPI